MSRTIDTALHAVQFFRQHASSPHRSAEIIVVDNHSTDGTWPLLSRYVATRGIRALRHAQVGAARARNHGRRHAFGRVLVFLDADTQLPPHALVRIMEHCDEDQKQAGIAALAALDGGWRARLWWCFWSLVRLLPMPNAKAMPALMFCTAAAFDEFGPFDEKVAIGEEWPILAGLYRARPQQFVYDRTLVARTSSRRMQRQRFGYLRTFFKYVWAIFFYAGRVNYTDQIR